MLVNFNPKKAAPTQARVRESRGPRWALIIGLFLLFSGCVFSTVSHLWQTRRQMKNFDTYIRFLESTETRGPGFEFLEPKLCSADIRTLASKREPSHIDTLSDRVRWTFRWHRTPRQRRKAIHLTLDFQNDLLRELHIDKRFTEALGNPMIETLLRSFLGGKTKLDLGEKHILCQVPQEDLAGYPVIDLNMLHLMFGRENTRFINKEDDLENKLLFRYRLAGAKGSKSAMSFGAVIHKESDELARITSRIGGFRLEFDLSQHPSYPR
jgi:hypothetical protein